MGAASVYSGSHWRLPKQTTRPLSFSERLKSKVERGVATASWHFWLKFLAIRNSSGSANWHDNKFIMFESYKGPLYCTTWPCTKLHPRREGELPYCWRESERRTLSQAINPSLPLLNMQLAVLAEAREPPDTLMNSNNRVTVRLLIRNECRRWSKGCSLCYMRGAD